MTKQAKVNNKTGALRLLRMTHAIAIIKPFTSSWALFSAIKRIVPLAPFDTPTILVLFSMDLFAFSAFEDELELSVPIDQEAASNRIDMQLWCVIA